MKIPANSAFDSPAQNAERSDGSNPCSTTAAQTAADQFAFWRSGTKHGRGNRGVSPFPPQSHPTQSHRRHRKASRRPKPRTPRFSHPMTPDAPFLRLDAVLGGHPEKSFSKNSERDVKANHAAGGGGWGGVRAKTAIASHAADCGRRYSRPGPSKPP